MSVRSLAWIRDALEASGDLVRAELRSAPDAAWFGVTIDNRQDCVGRIFFALPGEQTDGHRFAVAAFSAGSPALVISQAACAQELDALNAPYFLVNDTRRALTGLARTYRARLGARVVAITGSSGKTTTKEFVRAVLKTGFRVFANPGNLNSLVGVPMTILSADEDCEYLVCEVGTNHRGEIDELGALLRPDIAVITNIGDAHVGYFGSRDAIAQEKGALLRHLPEDGRAVLPRDDEYFERLNATVQGKKVSSFGRSNRADFRLGDVAFVEGRLTFSVNHEHYALAAVGEYNALNACAACAVGDACGIDSGRMRAAFAAMEATPGRGRIHTVGGVTLIDESYNASPSSLRRSIAMLASLEATRRIAVLGDMRELGEHADALHGAVGAEVAVRGIDRLYWLGQYGPVVRDAVRGVRPDIPVELYTGMDALVAAVLKDARAGDVVLVKASRGTRLDEFVSGFVDGLGHRD
ncbi:MAG TPA: UDP-N-acetylmuramoyl-tripeptide--D-alanyl-D-alanine ligase [Candidatus Krumholzibacteria bacterium]|nr:UDP-N-acetylmuramoyl-tripeptide--D-alanyl-D-alanine ligase [Candidatus Krumholzibacteria bacterium]